MKNRTYPKMIDSSPEEHTGAAQAFCDACQKPVEDKSKCYEGKCKVIEYVIIRPSIKFNRF